MERVVNFHNIFKRFVAGFLENNADNYKSEYWIPKIISKLKSDDFIQAILVVTEEPG
jgi:hypothetical protein